MNTIDNLKKELKIKENEYIMLDNSLVEMFDRDSNQSSINSVKKSLDKLSKEIMEIRNEIEKAYTFVKKDNGSVKSFYDSVKKENIEPKKEEHKLNYEKEYLMMPNTDNVISSNRFLVEFDKEKLNIPACFVNSVNFGFLSSRQIIVSIYNFVDEETNEPILANTKYKDIGTVTIKYLDAVGNLLYYERYENCNIHELCRDDLDYSNDNLNNIKLLIHFSTVKYETSH